ncbi:MULTISPECIES: IS5 family transposase [unclassified Streptomyces]|uniref:IS5 family transposase n=1 Tax=unclassified Streptomyces TaxID=2593676 RepID=UPI00225054AB|nr:MULTISPECIES: IS5 family transposase [unclassified Streptomyces]MCX4641977.1 IS5 family transposase [Streptomyces sp. NBC_01446]MCX5085709.1 IS5 family transposase [Streptomyces sp. NBC_00401]MCX5326850.1 IS5 family transposase [Streptomyces sp. NBC_00120]
MSAGFGRSADLVPDDLWERVAPLLPARAPRRHRYPGRLPVEDRAALRGIVYVLCKGVSWRDVPAEQVGCSGVTAWRRLRDWTEAGVWPRLHEVLLAELRAAGLLDMDDAAIDGSHVRALKRGAHTGPSPVDRARPGSKHHLIVDRHGTPLAVSLTSGNRHDVTQLMPLLDAVPRIRGLRGRPRHRPRRLFADRGYDYDKYRRLVRARGITPKIARRGVPHGSGLGKTRWVVERTFAWLHQFKRLRIRYEIRADLHLGLLQLACTIIYLRRLRTSF